MSVGERQPVTRVPEGHVSLQSQSHEVGQLSSRRAATDQDHRGSNAAQLERLRPHATQTADK